MFLPYIFLLILINLIKSSYSQNECQDFAIEIILYVSEKSSCESLCDGSEEKPYAKFLEALDRAYEYEDKVIANMTIKLLDDITYVKKSDFKSQQKILISNNPLEANYHFRSPCRINFTIEGGGSKIIFDNVLISFLVISEFTMVNTYLQFMNMGLFENNEIHRRFIHLGESNFPARVVLERVNLTIYDEVTSTELYDKCFFLYINRTMSPFSILIKNVNFFIDLAQSSLFVQVLYDSIYNLFTFFNPNLSPEERKIVIIESNFVIEGIMGYLPIFKSYLSNRNQFRGYLSKITVANTNFKNSLMLLEITTFKLMACEASFKNITFVVNQGILQDGASFFLFERSNRINIKGFNMSFTLSVSASSYVTSVFYLASDNLFVLEEVLIDELALTDGHLLYSSVQNKITISKIRIVMISDIKMIIYLGKNTDASFADSIVKDFKFIQDGVYLESTCTFIIRNVSVINISTDLGSFLRADDDNLVQISNSTFSNISTNDSASFLRIGTNCNILIESSIIRECTSTNKGGALLAKSNNKLTLFKTLFYQCQTHWDVGGAIYAGKFNKLTVLNGIFVECISNLLGGAIFTYIENRINILLTTFTKNKASTDGGAIRAMLSNNLTIFVSNIEFCWSYVSGGSLSLLMKNIVILNYVNFTNCMSLTGLGGSIFIEEFNTVVIDSSNFTLSSSNNSGGAIASITLARIIITETSFFRCTSIVYGGAIYISLYSILILSKIYIRENMASSGGALFARESCKIFIHNAIFGNCSANFMGGVAVMRSYSSFLFMNSEFDVIKSLGSFGSIFSITAFTNITVLFAKFIDCSYDIFFSSSIGNNIFFCNNEIFIPRKTLITDLIFSEADNNTVYIIENKFFISSPKQMTSFLILDHRWGTAYIENNYLSTNLKFKYLILTNVMNIFISIKNLQLTSKNFETLLNVFDEEENTFEKSENFRTFEIRIRNSKFLLLEKRDAIPFIKASPGTSLMLNNTHIEIGMEFKSNFIVYFETFFLQSALNSKAYLKFLDCRILQRKMSNNFKLSYNSNTGSSFIEAGILFHEINFENTLIQFGHTHFTSLVRTNRLSIVRLINSKLYTNSFHYLSSESAFIIIEIEKNLSPLLLRSNLTVELRKNLIAFSKFRSSGFLRINFWNSQLATNCEVIFISNQIVGNRACYNGLLVNFEAVPFYTAIVTRALLLKLVFFKNDIKLLNLYTTSIFNFAFSRNIYHIETYLSENSQFMESSYNKGTQAVNHIFSPYVKNEVHLFSSITKYIRIFQNPDQMDSNSDLIEVEEKNIYKNLTFDTVRLLTPVKNREVLNNGCYFVFGMFDNLNSPRYDYSEFEANNNTFGDENEPFLLTDEENDIRFKLHNTYLCAINITYTSNNRFQAGVELTFKIFVFKSFPFLKYLHPLRNKNMTIHFSFKKCDRGEVQNPETSTCIPCSKHYFSSDENLYFLTACIQCQEKDPFFCYGGNMRSPRESHWRLSYLSTKFLTCPNRPSCLGDIYFTKNESLSNQCLACSFQGTLSSFADYSFDKKFSSTGMCAVGYKGFLCSECVRPIYGSAGQNKCYRCGDSMEELKQILKLIFKVIILYWGVWTALMMNEDLKKFRGNFSEEFEKSTSASFMIKIFMQHFQVLMIFMKLPYKFPGVIQELISILVISGAPEFSTVFSDDCFLMKHEIDIKLPYFIVICIMFFDIGSVIILLLAIVIYHARKSVARSRKIIFRTRTASKTVKKYVGILKNYLRPVVLVFFLTNLVGQVQPIIDLYICTELGDPDNTPSEYRLMKDFSIDCTSINHTLFKLSWGIPWMMFVGIMLPYEITSKLIKAKRANRLYKEEFLSRYGYFYFPYKQSISFYEIFVWTKKILIMIVEILLTKSLVDDSFSFPLILLFLILFISLMIHRVLKPYDMNYFQMLYNTEWSSLALNLSNTIMACLLTLANDEKEDKFFITATIYVLVTNILFVIYWIHGYFKIIRKKVFGLKIDIFEQTKNFINKLTKAFSKKDRITYNTNKANLDSQNSSFPNEGFLNPNPESKTLQEKIKILKCQLTLKDRKIQNLQKKLHFFQEFVQLNYSQNLALDLTSFKSLAHLPREELVIGEEEKIADPLNITAGRCKKEEKENRFKIIDSQPSGQEIPLFSADTLLQKLRGDSISTYFWEWELSFKLEGNCLMDGVALSTTKKSGLIFLNLKKDTLKTISSDFKISLGVRILNEQEAWESLIHGVSVEFQIDYLNAFMQKRSAPFSTVFSLKPDYFAKTIKFKRRNALANSTSLMMDSANSEDKLENEEILEFKIKGQNQIDSFHSKIADTHLHLISNGKTKLPVFSPFLEGVQIFWQQDHSNTPSILFSASYEKGRNECTKADKFLRLYFSDPEMNSSH